MRGVAPALLVTSPLAGALLYAGLAVGTGEEALVYLVLRQGALALATAGCLGAALAFQRGEYLWWAWVLQALTYGLAALDNLLPAPEGAEAGWLAPLRLGLYVALNVAGMAGALLLALSTLRGGLGLPGAPALRAAVLGGTAAIGVALTAPTVRLSLSQLAVGQPAAEVALDLVSTISDGACFLLGAPLLVIAVALRGSALATTFWLLAASNASWLVSDELLTRAHAEPPWAVPGHALLIAACLAAAAAGCAHRRAAQAAARPAMSWRGGAAANELSRTPP